MFTTIALVIAAVFAFGTSYSYTSSSGYMIMDSILNSMCKFSESGSSGGAVYTFIENIYGIVIPMALALALCYCILDMFSAISRVGLDNVTASVLFLPLIKFCICWIFIKYGLKISGQLLEGSNYLVDQVQAAVQSMGKNATIQAATGVDQSGLLARILFQLLPGMLSLFGQIIAGIILAFQVISIRIEFLIRIAFLPLAIASIAQGGAQSAGARYIKRLVGNMFLMMGIIATVEIVYLLIFVGMPDLAVFDASTKGGQVVNNILVSIFSGLVGPFAAVGCVSALKSTISDAFG